MSRQKLEERFSTDEALSIIFAEQDSYKDEARSARIQMKIAKVTKKVVMKS